MAQAHAAHKGAVGLELGDEAGHKEMIDAPMLKQVTLVAMHASIRLTFYSLGGEDNPNGTRCRPSRPTTALRTVSFVWLSPRCVVDVNVEPVMRTKSTYIVHLYAQRLT
jgi:hypothetical protein